MKIFYDVDTQNDFMNKDGALYVPDAELIKPNLRSLTNFARNNFIPVVGSVDKHFGTPEYKHREQELKRWGGPFPDHCMNSTFGQQKITETTLAYDWREMENLGLHIPHMMYHGYPKEPIPEAVREFWKCNPEELKEIWEENLRGIDYGFLNQALTQIKNVTKKKQYPLGIYFEKQSYDIFTNPNFAEFLEQAKIREAVVYGVATDYCVKAAVLGMQQRKVQCYIVEDTIKGVEEATTKTALEEMAKAGATLVTTKDVLEWRLN